MSNEGVIKTLLRTYVDSASRDANALAKGNGYYLDAQGLPAQELNAIQHAYVSAQLSYYYSERDARINGDLKEWVFGKVFGEAPGDTLKDQYNNEIGRQIGRWVKEQGMGPGMIDRLIIDAVRNSNRSHAALVASAGLKASYLSGAPNTVVGSVGSLVRRPPRPRSGEKVRHPCLEVGIGVLLSGAFDSQALSGVAISRQAILGKLKALSLRFSNRPPAAELFTLEKRACDRLQLEAHIPRSAADNRGHIECGDTLGGSRWVQGRRRRATGCGRKEPCNHQDVSAGEHPTHAGAHRYALTERTARASLEAELFIRIAVRPESLIIGSDRNQQGLHSVVVDAHGH
ncbi:MAG: hypothetical protein QOJ91_284 [Sphingomonadales bacterium]|nr:hypothetical protein [Sphingomonadales bacterium]